MKNAFKNIEDEARRIASAEPLLLPKLEHFILRFDSFEAMAAHLIASSIADPYVKVHDIERTAAEIFRREPSIVASIMSDLHAVLARDPATTGPVQILLNQKGFQALQVYRIAHALWTSGRRDAAQHLQGRASIALGPDIHPASAIGSGIMLDHGSGIVIGETCTIDDDVSIMQSVTLGGTGKDEGDRHPKVRTGVLIGTGAVVLGAIVIGESAKVAAGSVVLHDVPPHTTVAGVPARVVGTSGRAVPAISMEQRLSQD
ncbi:serine O-acetyltransferase [Trinickia terrae]|uniref:Serine acetyltransferase n=1 Tax=Trinickia terrae TaxID=2571161 RepID=A0A4U1HX35_9BURK|nr:serine O-acetyltransferase EpsC [Trinickia terrae]TKC86279.1 serine O-acetyltransferase [Trinickia terrae]